MNYIIHLSILIVIMLAAGILGGISNFYLNKEEEVNLKECIIIGVCASLLVPLFLNMISSELIKSSQDDPYKILIFTGFCLIAAITSRAFIKNLSDRMIKEIQELSQKTKAVDQKATEAMQIVSDVKDEIEPLTNKETEPDNQISILEQSETIDLSDEEKRILNSFRDSQYTYRTLSGISNQTNNDEQKINYILTQLAARGFLGQRRGSNGKTWFITEQGRRIAQD